MKRAALLAVVALAAWAPAAAALPVITPKLFGTAGNNGWYRSNVTVNWTVVDDQGLPIVSTQGCDPSTLTNDTPPSGTKTDSGSGSDRGAAAATTSRS